MNKFKISILSLGFTILGISCISWSIISLWTQSNYSTSTNEIINYKYDNISSSSVEEEEEEEDENNEGNKDSDKMYSSKVSYLPYPSVGENIGILSIPVLEQEFPIIQGTGDKELKKGVGHFLQSVLPGEKDNCVLSGHRDTVFRKLNDLKIGDLLILTTSAGTFTYKIDSTRIVDEDDKTVIIPTKNAVLTLTTCYPFDNFKLVSERYIVSAVLIKNE